MSRRPGTARRGRGRLPVLVGLVVLAVLIPGSAVAAQLAVTSDRLGAATTVPPPFHLTAVTVTAGTKDTSRPSQGDVLVVRLSQRLSAGSVCPGAPDGSPQTLTGVTLELVDGGAAPDSLRIGSGPTECPAPKALSFTLGSTAYSTGGIISLTDSSITLQYETGSASTLTVTLGKPSRRPAAVSAATVVTAVPDPALRDTSGRAISLGTAATTSKVHF